MGTGQRELMMEKLLFLVPLVLCPVVMGAIMLVLHRRSRGPKT